MSIKIMRKWYRKRRKSRSDRKKKREREIPAVGSGGQVKRL